MHYSYMTSVIGYYFGKSSRSCWRGNYPYDGKGYWDGDVVWGQGGGLSAFVLCVMQPKRAKWRIFTVQWMI